MCGCPFSQKLQLFLMDHLRGFCRKTGLHGWRYLVEKDLSHPGEKISSLTFKIHYHSRIFVLYFGWLCLPLLGKGTFSAFFHIFVTQFTHITCTFSPFWPQDFVACSGQLLLFWHWLALPSLSSPAPSTSWGRPSSPPWTRRMSHSRRSSSPPSSSATWIR